jgi:hypothetical protein
MATYKIVGVEDDPKPVFESMERQREVLALYHKQVLPSLRKNSEQRSLMDRTEKPPTG